MPQYKIICSLSVIEIPGRKKTMAKGYKYVKKKTKLIPQI